jgi:hypothetical protein
MSKSPYKGIPYNWAYPTISSDPMDALGSKRKKIDGLLYNRTIVITNKILVRIIHTLSFFD